MTFPGSIGGQPVTVGVASGGLIVETAGTERVWLYSDVRVTHSEPAIFAHRNETLAMADASILSAIARSNPEAFAKLRGDVTASPWNWVIGSIAAVIFVCWAIWVFLIPAMAGAVASRIPVEWEDKLGQAVETGFLAESGECTAQPAVRAVEEIVRRLDRAAPSDYKFRVKISRSDQMNAFAAPGGHIVVLRGLIERAETPEEVAGVLAHEMEHVRQRHVTRGMFRQLTIAALFGMLFGDAGAAGSIVQGLGSLQFQREDEASADREGMRNLARADIDPMAMISFFRKLQKEEVELPRGAEYLSSHPNTQDRVEALQELAKQLDFRERPLESRATWLQTRGLCK